VHARWDLALRVCVQTRVILQDVYVKVVEITPDMRTGDMRVHGSMKAADQESGADLDPGNRMVPGGRGGGGAPGGGGGEGQCLSTCVAFACIGRDGEREGVPVGWYTRRENALSLMLLVLRPCMCAAAREQAMYGWMYYTGLARQSR
jgi:hypothetical protein